MRLAAAIIMITGMAYGVDWRMASHVGDARLATEARTDVTNTVRWGVTLPPGRHPGLTVCAWVRAWEMSGGSGYTAGMRAPTTMAFWCPDKIQRSNPDLLQDAGGHSGEGVDLTALGGALTVADFPFTAYTNIPAVLAGREQWARGVYTLDGESEQPITVTLGGRDVSLPAGEWNVNAHPGVADGVVVSGAGRVRIGISQAPLHRFYDALDGVVDGGGNALTPDSVITNELVFCTWRITCDDAQMQYRSTIARLNEDWDDVAVTHDMGSCAHLDGDGIYEVGLVGLSFVDRMAEIFDARVFPWPLTDLEIERIYHNGQQEIARREIPQWRDAHLTFTWVDAVPPSITLGANYGGPADWDKAEYNSGGGWTKYSGDKTLPIVAGNRIRFRGDWRNDVHSYDNMFNSTLNEAGYPLEMSGQLTFPDHRMDTGLTVYLSVFNQGLSVIRLLDNPLPPAWGHVGSQSFNYVFRLWNNLTGTLPRGFLDTSRCVFTSTQSMFRETLTSNIKIVPPLPKGFMDTRGQSSTTIHSFTLYYSIRLQTTEKFELPDGFLDFSGVSCNAAVLLSYDPGLTQPYGHNQSQWVIGDHNFRFGAGMEFTPENVTFLNNWLPRSTLWTGQVYWGDDLLVNKIPVPAQKTTVFKWVTGMPGWAELHPYWKDQDL